MRSTAPSLRRRNYARRRSLRQPLSRRDDSDSDDGLASGEDTGPDSDSDDDEPLFRPSRPAAGVGRANPAVGGVPAARLGAGSGSPSSRVVQPVVRPVTRPAAQPPVQSVTRPIVQATSRPVAQPVVRPGAQPVVRPGAQPVVRPAAQPVVQPVAEPVAPPVVLQPAAPPSPTPSPVLPGVTLGADEGGVDEADDSVSDGISSGIDSGSDSESDVETTTPGAPPPATPLPTGITPVLGAPPDVALPPPAATTSPGASPVLAPADPSATPAGQLTGSPSQTTGALTSSNAALTPLPSLDLTSTLAIPPGRTGVGDALAENETAGNTLGPIATEEQPVNAGMAAGIVIGVLALIGLIVGAVFFWRKWKRNGGELPPLPLFRRTSKRDSAPDMAYNGNTMEKDTIPILPPPSYGSKKTNSEMMDQLMQATYRTESGTYDPETGTFGQKGGAQNEPLAVAPSPDPHRPGFLDEKAYTALAGPPTPMNKPKPVLQWLDNIKTPRQSGVVRWPSTDAPPIPPSSTQSIAQDSRQAAAPQPFSKPPIPNFLPPEPAFRNEARYTATTNTTTTTGTSAWYG